MPDINILIKKYEPQIAKYFSKRVEEIDKEIDILVAPLLKEKLELQQAIRQLNGSSLNIISDGVSTSSDKAEESKYNKEWSNIEKAIFLTRHEWLSLTAIAEKINEFEPDQDVDTLKKSLSAVFSMDIAKEENSRLERRRNANGKWEYIDRKNTAKDFL